MNDGRYSMMIYFMSIHPAIALLAERQYGVVTSAQIVDHGVSDRGFAALLQSGGLVAMTRCVYRVAGAPQSWEQRVVAAWLASTGPTHIAVVGRATAAALYRFHGYERKGTPVLVTTRGGSARSPLAIVATCKDLRPKDITTFSPSELPVTTRGRTAFDLALAQPTNGRLDRFIDRCLLDQQTTIAEQWELLLHAQARGKSGIARFRRALADRSGVYVPLESELEHLAVEALMRRGVPAPVRQHPLPGAPFGRVDLAFPAARLVVELDGRQHQLLTSRRADYERDVAAARMGWQVIRFDWSQVKYSPEWFAQAVDDVRRTRERLFGARSSFM